MPELVMAPDQGYLDSNSWWSNPRGFECHSRQILLFLRLYINRSPGVPIIVQEAVCVQVGYLLCSFPFPLAFPFSIQLQILGPFLRDIRVGMPTQRLFVMRQKKKE